MAGIVEHRLMELLHKKDMEVGTRLSLSQHAKAIGVSKRSLDRWLDVDDPTTRFDADVLAKFCKYFDVEIKDVLVYVPEEDSQ